MWMVWCAASDICLGYSVSNTGYKMNVENKHKTLFSQWLQFWILKQWWVSVTVGPKLSRVLQRQKTSAVHSQCLHVRFEQWNHVKCCCLTASCFNGIPVDCQQCANTSLSAPSTDFLDTRTVAGSSSVEIILLYFMTFDHPLLTGRSTHRWMCSNLPTHSHTYTQRHRQSNTSRSVWS